LISAKGTRVAGTCEWITRNEEYRVWLDSSNVYSERLLWISGGPGKGKTMMSIFLTEELENYTARKSNAEMLFFFCSAQDEKRNTGVAVLRGILYQIIAKRPQLIKHALPYFETPERAQQTLLSLETLWIIFTKLVTDTALGIMFCVLDGLDECDVSTTRVLLPRIVGLLADKTSQTMGVFKLVVVSREIHALRGCSCSRIRLDPDNDAKVYGDIDLFVSTRVQELSGVEGFNNNFQSFVQASLIKRAEGTFLWVGFAMYELSQKQTCSEIFQVLKDLPTGLPAIYDRMLLQIPGRHREVSQAILRWVTMAVRPLRLEELADAVSLQACYPRMTPAQVIHDAIAQCGPLLKIHRQRVRLIHQSARDYLLREEQNSNAVLDAFRLRAEPSHLELARKCLDCLAQSSLQHKVIDWNAETDFHKSALLGYATRNWPYHAKNCSALAARLIDPHGFFLQKTSPLRNNWWDSYRKVRSGLPKTYQSLHIACCLGIVPWVQAVLSKRIWMLGFQKHVNKKNEDGTTALHIAAVRGIEAGVQLLLDQGADIEAKSDKYRQTALHLAVRRRDVSVIQLLLDRGANIDAMDCYGRKALHIAAHGGDEAFIQSLLESGFGIDTVGQFGIPAQHLGTVAGNKAVVKLLLERGADINAKDLYEMTALHYSARLAMEDVVRLLVDRGADVNAKDDNGDTALQIAKVASIRPSHPDDREEYLKRRRAIIDLLRSRMEHRGIRINT
jgi:ankyrin repeat protein